MSTVSADPVTGNIAAPSPSTRIFSARLAFQMRPGAQSGADTPLSALMGYLEGLAEAGNPVLAEELANAVELAMKTVAP